MVYIVVLKNNHLGRYMAGSSSEYIKHHLKNWSNREQVGIIDMGVLNYDTIVMSVICAVLAFFVMWLIARKSVSGVPSRTQALFEVVVDMAATQSSSIVHGAKDLGFIAPLALTIFMWVLFMNALDFLPVDMMGILLHALHVDVHEFRIVPTADLNGTFGVSAGVTLLTFLYGAKAHGFLGFVSGLFTAPFHGSGFISKLLLAPINFAENVLGYLAKTISLAMRLFGNMYAGELIFMLIAVLGATWTWWGFLGHWLLGSAWAIFHILVIALQAFIMMMLALVYLGQAHEKH
jgi:F-type H+-transporting ATPase subunit a